MLDMIEKIAFGTATMIYVLLSSSMLNLNLSIIVFNDIKPPHRPYKAVVTYSIFIPFQAKRFLTKNVTKINIINDKIYIFFFFATTFFLQIAIQLFKFFLLSSTVLYNLMYLNYSILSNSHNLIFLK